MKPQVLRTLDLFAGCGGLTAGFAMAEGPGSSGFECVGAIDNWQVACDAFSLNHEVAATCDGVSEKSVGKILDSVGDVDVVTGGPPCQGFSTSGKRALDDPRNGLVKAFFAAVAMANPRAFLMENVHGFTTFQDGAIMREVIALAQSLGYRTFHSIVYAVDCGVPQRRRRFILVGLRDGTFRFPASAHMARTAGPEDPQLFENTDDSDDIDPGDRPEGFGRRELTFLEATSDLPAIGAGEAATEYASKPRNAFQRWARTGAPRKLMDHVAGSHKPYFVEMMSHIPQGRSAMEPEIQAHMPARLRPKTGFPNSYARIRGDEPSPTITRNFTTPSSANCIHPLLNRSLTLREGARCQSFPDRYRFAGRHGDRRLMIGNAVPPLMGRALGNRLLSALCGLRRGRVVPNARAV